MPLPISTSAFDKLGKRILRGAELPGDEQTFENVAHSYLLLAEQVVSDLARIGYPGAVPRVKTRGSLLDKMRRNPTWAISKINDLGGLRLIVGPVAFLKGQKFVGGHVLPHNAVVGAGRWAQRLMKNKIIREFSDTKRSAREPQPVDRCEQGKDSSGYRAVHIIVYPDGVPIEIQLRTQLQHSWAEISERLGDRWGRGFRYGGLPNDPDETISQDTGVTRAMIIKELQSVAQAVNDYEEAQFRADNRLIRSWLTGDSRQRSIAEGQRRELDQLYGQLQGMLEEFGRNLGVME